MASPFNQRRHRSGHYKAIRVAADFLRGVGFDVREGTAPDGCFFPGVWYGGGTMLCYDPRIAHVGDLLHDAGHLAVLPSRLRRYLGVGCVYNEMVNRARADAQDEAMHASLAGCDDMAIAAVDLTPESLELAATAWSYAASEACEIHPFRVFDVTWVIKGHEGPVPNAMDVLLRELWRLDHPGVNLLARVGLTANVQAFPKMVDWLAP